MAVDEFFVGRSMAVASTSSKLAQVTEQRDDRDEDAHSSRDTSASQQDIEEECSSKFASESESESESAFASASASASAFASESKSEYAAEPMLTSSTSSSAASTGASTSSPSAGSVVISSVLASSALSMSALSSGATTTSTPTTASTAAMEHVGSLTTSCVSAFDESLMNRPTEELFEQVRANRPKHRGDAVRSSDLQLHDLEASHNRRMEELNRIALDQLGNRISNLDHDRLSSSYQPHSSQFDCRRGRHGSGRVLRWQSMAVASTSSKLAQVTEQRDDRDEDARSSRDTSASQQDIEEECSSKFASESESASASAFEFESESESESAFASASASASAFASESKSEYAAEPMLTSSTSSSAASTVVRSLVRQPRPVRQHGACGLLDESCVSAFDESLMNRPTEELFEQVRANRPKHRGDAVRSSDLQLHDLEASHNRRMEELNRIALDQLGNRISNLDHDRLSSSYQPHSSQLTAGEGGMAVDEFFVGRSMAVASTSSKLAQVTEQRDDRDEDARSSRDTSASQQDIEEECSSKFASESESASASAFEFESESESESAFASAAASTGASTSSPSAGSVVISSVLASSALSMSALSSGAITTSTPTTASTAAMEHVGSLDESCVSAFDESLMNRPTEELFEQVRANRPKHRGDAVRSSDLQLHDLEASHNRRMEELNRIALDQLGNRISNLDHDRLSSSYQPHSSQLTAGEGGMAVDEFFVGRSMAVASTSSKLAQVTEQRDDRDEDARSSRDTSASQQDIEEECSSKFASESESASASAFEFESESESESAFASASASASAFASESKSEYAAEPMLTSSTSSSAASTGASTSSPSAGSGHQQCPREQCALDECTVQWCDHY
ncbi:uncharacterized protein KRP23_11038 [Phytophthora ramorum]|uniref:uncharacterized protein n=1 Tax=Phytophthora ramorum TaxID=164328 RepID=UPI0030A29A5F|nr:hypothetical protein KRP23_11038 [Phytophthora ramorum]